jgi:short-subunit dehydrogenase
MTSDTKRGMGFLLSQVMRPVIFFLVFAFGLQTGLANEINGSDHRAGGHYALVAGGSRGIGFSIAEALAKRGFNLILIARHIEGLRQAEHKLESRYNVRVEVLAYDLSEEPSARAIAKWCIDRDIPLKMLCNVAGLGGENDYPSLPLDTLRYMVNLNVESCMALSYLLLPLLEKNAPSYIMNVSSMAGYAPIPEKNM